MARRPFSMVDDAGRSATRGAGGQLSQSAAAWVHLVRDVAEKLTSIFDLPTIARTVSEEIRRGLGASAVIFNVLTPDGSALETLVADGVGERTHALLARPIPIRDTPAVAALAKGRPVIWSSLSQRDEQYPAYSAFPSSSRAWVVLPLAAEGRPIGALSIGWAAERNFEEVELAVLGVIAHQCALAVDRARLDRVRRAERETLELLGEGTRLMVSALEPATVVRALVDLAVPRLAPWCAVFVEREGMLRCLTLAIEPADGDSKSKSELEGLTAVPVESAVPIAVAFRSGETVLVHPITEELVRAVYSEPQADRLLPLKTEWTGLMVPIKAGGKTIGVMSLVSHKWSGTPPDEVRFAGEGLAGRAGVALSNAERYQDERRTAAMLVQAILPPRLPAIEGYDLAARYLPAGARVAGDWYDVARLSPDHHLIGIGDAGGHGIPAASLMGQLRNGARALAVSGRGPSQVLAELAKLTTEEDSENFATAAYGVLDTTAHTMRFASAGHLPPLVARGRQACYLPVQPGPPLGAPFAAAPEQMVPLPEGTSLVLVTDGVVEKRAVDLDTGMRLLSDLVTRNAGATASGLTELIAEQLCETAEDDCCILVLRRL